MRPTVLAIFLLLLCAPAAFAADTGTQTAPQLASTAPWLTQTTVRATPAPTANTVDSAATATVTTSPTAASVPPLTNTPEPVTTSNTRGNLPFTGDNLLPETLAAVLLIIAGIVIRLRWRPRW